MILKALITITVLGCLYIIFPRRIYEDPVWIRDSEIWLVWVLAILWVCYTIYKIFKVVNEDVK